MTYTRPKYKTGSFYKRKKALITKWELNVISETLNSHHCDILKSAKALGMTYSAFYLLIKKHGMKTRNGKVMK